MSAYDLRRLFKPFDLRRRRIPNPPEFFAPPVFYKCIACDRRIAVQLSEAVADGRGGVQMYARITHDAHVTPTGEMEPRCVRAMHLIGKHYRDKAAMIVTYPDEPQAL